MKLRELRQTIALSMEALQAALPVEIQRQLRGGGDMATASEGLLTKRALFTLADIMGASNARFLKVYASIVDGIRSDDRAAFVRFTSLAANIEVRIHARMAYISGHIVFVY